MSENPTDIIRTPGKFEGEPVYVRTLWDSTMDGCEDDTLYDGDTPVSVFFVDAAMRAAFDLPAQTYAIILWESETGFVNSRLTSRADYDQLVTDLASADDGEQE